MKKKAFLCGLLSMVMVLASGCGSVVQPDDYATNKVDGVANVSESTPLTKEENSDTGSMPDSAGDDASTGGIPKDEIKVGVIHLTDPAEGSGYTYTHDLGIQGMQANLGLSDEQIVRKINVDDTDNAAIEAAIQECVDEGCNIIFSTSWGYMDVTAEMAEEYPDIYFSHGTGYKSNGKNFNNYFGRIYQARYLSGIVAGMNTVSDKIGYVAAMDSSNSEVTGGIDAFALGVYSVNQDAKIYVKVTDSWYDPEAEEASSSELLDMGCDVLAQHCDTPYPQTMAQSRGAFSIGYNSDMSKDAPESCLVSVIWNWSAYYTQAVQSVIDGSWDGSNYYGGISDGLVDITSLASFCAEGTQDKVDEAKALMMSGEFNVFDGVIETNTGDTVGEEGSTMDDATITGSLNWYFKTVEVVD